MELWWSRSLGGVLVVWKSHYQSISFCPVLKFSIKLIDQEMFLFLLPHDGVAGICVVVKLKPAPVTTGSFVPHGLKVPPYSAPWMHPVSGDTGLVTQGGRKGNRQFVDWVTAEKFTFRSIVSYSRQQWRNKTSLGKFCLFFFTVETQIETTQDICTAFQL